MLSYQKTSPRTLSRTYFLLSWSRPTFVKFPPCLHVLGTKIPHSSGALFCIWSTCTVLFLSSKRYRRKKHTAAFFVAVNARFINNYDLDNNPPFFSFSCRQECDVSSDHYLAVPIHILSQWITVNLWLKCFGNSCSIKLKHLLLSFILLFFIC